EVHDRAAGDRPLVRRLEHAALDGRDVLARDHAAHDLIDKLHARATRQRRDPNPAITVLPTAAGLLLVLPLSLRFSAERFAGGDFGFCGLRVDPELPRQSPDDDLEMPLTESPDEGLGKLAVVLVMERGILFVQLMQPGRQLVFLPALLYLDGDGDHRLG